MKRGTNRYNYVQGVIDTGPTMAKVRSVSSSEYVRRRDEINYRISRGQLADLFNEYAVPEYETIGDYNDNETKIVTHDSYDQQNNTTPYLILDGRSEEAYAKNHILQSYNYPYTYMKRDILPRNYSQYRNREGCLIIVYCDDEKISREMAKTFVDRGTFNIYLLNGGLLSFATAFPSYIEGEMPKNLPSPPKNRNSRLTKSNLQRAGLDSIPENKSSTMKYKRHLNSTGGGGGGGGNNSLLSSRTNKSVADTIISRASSRKGKVKGY